MSDGELQGWDRLRHGGLLLDAQRLRAVAAFAPDPLFSLYERELRKRAGAILDDADAKTADVSSFVSFVMQQICGFTESTGSWQRGPQVPAEWGRVAITGETVKPRHLWEGHRGGVLPVFIDREKRVGIGRGRKVTSQVLQWLRAGSEQLALITNGRQWRLVFAGLDFDAWCEWDLDLWLEEGELSTQVTALRTLLQPALWMPKEKDVPAPLLQAVLDSRKGQAELSQILGERVREAVEILVQGHGEGLKQQCGDVDPAEIYRAAVRMVMRMVVVLFAESRELLPRDNALYHGAYGLGGLLEELEKVAARGGNRLARSWGAWPRVLALFRLVHEGSHHPSLPVPAYGGELFAQGDAGSSEGLLRALAVFENACFEHEVLPDRDVHRILDHITRTRVKLRQGRASTWVPTPVDFSDLSSEYIGILYEGLLDFELKTAPPGDPVIFLAVGNQPALPLSRLEEMDDKALKDLLAQMKDTSSSDGADSESEEDAEEEAGEAEDSATDEADEGEISEEGDIEAAEEDDDDERHTTRTRAEVWARRAAEVGKLVRKPRGKLTSEKRLVFEEALGRKARQLVTRVVLPGEWYLLRWGGTRKGTGTFYTRPGLAVPTVQRTLRPLAWNAPASTDGTPDRDAPPTRWAPKKPEEILALKIVDPACGSGTFPVAALRFLTDALYASLHHHKRIREQGDRAVVALLTGPSEREGIEERLCEELLPCRPDDELFESRLKAVLRRHAVERCIYGVDIDPLAVELCRLALWVETMDRTLPFSFLDHKVKCGDALVGAWFDQFQHYPAMAWKNREGGDKSHSNGVHFQKDARTKALKAFEKATLQPDLGNHLLHHAWVGVPPSDVHDEALAVFEELHAMPVVDAGERARLYRERLLGSDSWQQLKSAFDRWCACWFWPAGRLGCAPLPSSFSAPSQETHELADDLARSHRFFHWELEFPDVFSSERSGFHAVIGNPPWDTAKANSKEFFSNLDPLYRGLGQPEARQTQLFDDRVVEEAWLDYNAAFKSLSNIIRYAATPFGDAPEGKEGRFLFSLSRSPRVNKRLHDTWRTSREESQGFADPDHTYRHQGGADLNLYKLFTERMYRLLRPSGRMGVILPAGIYSDHGTSRLRELLINQSDLEWLFGFENRTKIFPIDTRFRFCCLVAQRDSDTKLIRAAFGARDTLPWESAAPRCLAISREDIDLFSPVSRSVPEIDTTKALEIMRSIYSDSVLIGEGKGWRTEYVREYDMTSSRKKNLIHLAERMLTDGPVSSSTGIAISGSTPYVPLYTGKMIEQYDFLYQAWISGHGKQSKWEVLPFDHKRWRPEFVVALRDVKRRWSGGTRMVFRDITISTNERTAIASIVPAWPCGNKVPVLAESGVVPVSQQLVLCALMNSFAYDYIARTRITGINLNKFILDETPIPRAETIPQELVILSARLCLCHEIFASAWLELADQFDELEETQWEDWWASETSERVSARAAIEAIVAVLYGLSEDQFRWVLRDCDIPASQLSSQQFRSQLPSKGFWRTGIGLPHHEMRRAWDCDAELRLPVLALVAYRRLSEAIADCTGDMATAVKHFAPLPSGGWRVPDEICLAEFGLGTDKRATERQPVLPRLAEETSIPSSENRKSWRECRQLASQHREAWAASLPDIVPQSQTTSKKTTDSPHAPELPLFKEER